MYGTIARIQVKRGMEKAFNEYGRRIQAEAASGAGATPGQIGFLMYQMDNNPNELYMVAMFESRETYHANAQSQEQHQQYLELIQFLEKEPEWHDGEIIFSSLQ